MLVYGEDSAERKSLAFVSGPAADQSASAAQINPDSRRTPPFPLGRQISR
jgi:hypothetical protein